MERTGQAAVGSRADRVEWVDFAKGISIILVVMMHSTLGVEKAMGAAGWLHPLVEFAKPFRMPAFFLISGLFLARTIDAPWRRFLDRKVVHFFYFYVLWLTIQFAFKGPEMVVEEGAGTTLMAYAEAFYQPFGTLWFIYVLPIFLVFTRLVKQLPVWLVLAWAVLLEALPIATGSVIYDEFAARYVYFFIGYAFASRIFALERWSERHAMLAAAALALWAVWHGFLSLNEAPARLTEIAQVFTWDSAAVMWTDLAGLSLISGLLGSAAIVVLCSFLAKVDWAWPLRWVGSQSIVIYLAFFLPMAVTRIVLVKVGIITDVGTLSLIVWAAAVTGPVVLYLMVRWTGWGRFLFERPAWARLERKAGPRQASSLVAGE